MNFIKFNIVKRVHEFLIKIYSQNYGARVWMEKLSELSSLQFSFNLLNHVFIRHQVARSSQAFPSNLYWYSCLYATSVVSNRQEICKPKEIIPRRISYSFNTDKKFIVYV